MPVYFFIKVLFLEFKEVSGGVIEMIPTAVAEVGETALPANPVLPETLKS